MVVIVRSHAVLELTEQALRDVGHRVLVTTDPGEALTVADELRVDLVVADAADLVYFRKRPHAPRLLEIGNGDGAGSEPTLRRPFSLAELQEAVAAALNA